MPRTFAEAPGDQGRGKAKDAMVELDRGNLVITIRMRRVGVKNFVAAAPGGLEAQDCYYVGDDDSVSRDLRLATDVVWDASLKEAAQTKEKPLLVFQRLAIKRKLHLMVAAEAGYKIETPEQIAMFENLYEFTSQLEYPLASRGSLVLMPKLTSRIAKIESHVLTAWGKAQYLLAIENQQYVFKVYSIRLARMKAKQRDRASRRGDAATYVAAGAVGVTAQDVELVGDLDCDARVREVAAALASLKGAAKAAYIEQVRARIDAAEEEMDDEEDDEDEDAESSDSGPDSDSVPDSGSGSSDSSSDSDSDSSSSDSDSDSDAPPPPPKKKRRGPPPKKTRPPRATPSPSSSPTPSSGPSPLKERHQALSERLRSLGGRRAR